MQKQAAIKVRPGEIKEDMAPPVKGRDANPRAGDDCKFELKEYHWTLFNCYVCMKDSYERERYRCDHCDRSRHKDCIKLDKETDLGPGPDGILGKCPKFKLFSIRDVQGKKYCIVCGMQIHHIGYYCGENIQKSSMIMHPCCAKLARSGNNAKTGQNKKFAMKKETRSCVRCGRSRPWGASQDNPNKNFCWSYSSSEGSKQYCIHVYCLEEVVIHALKQLVPSGSRQQSLPKIILPLPKNKDKGDLWKKAVEDLFQTAVELSTGIPMSALSLLISLISSD